MFVVGVQIEDKMDVVGHYDELVEFYSGETLGKRFPCVFSNMAYLWHLKIGFASLQTYGQEICSWLAIIIALET